LDSNVLQGLPVVMSGDVPSSKCYFLRKWENRFCFFEILKIFFFNRLPTSQHASVQSGGGFFSWGAKFRYSGRTEREIMSESLHALKEKLNTSPSKRKANSVPATPSSPKGDLTDIRKCSMFCMTILKIEKKNIW
jgi:hypothetical protein